MDLFGMGVMELLVILVVALVVLGPAKTVNMARGAGKMIGEVRRAFGDLSRAVEEEGSGLERGTRGADAPDRDRGKPPEEPR